MSKRTAAVSKTYVAIAVVIVAIVAVAVVAVAGVFPVSQTVPQTPQLKIAGLAEGPANDLGWYQAGLEGVKSLSDLGEVSTVDRIPTADLEKVAKQFADEGYTIIFGHGFEYGEPFKNLAPSYPNTLFAVAGYFDTGTAPNFIGYLAAIHESAYLGGVLAGHLTQTGKIGYVTGYKIPSTLVYGNGFKLGAWSVNKNIQIIDVYTNDWFDTGKGKEAGESMIDSGVDFIYVGFSPGGVGTMRAAEERNVLVMGNIYDQNPLAPKVIVTSNKANWEPVMRAIVEDHNNNRIQKTYIMGMKEGAADLADFHGLVSSDIADKIKTVREDIIAGRLVVPTIDDRDVAPPT